MTGRESAEEPAEEGEEIPGGTGRTKLLDRLLYRGVLPRADSGGSRRDSAMMSPTLPI